MGGSDNQQIVKDMFERAINQRDDTVFDELIAGSYVNYDMPMPETGPAGLRALMGGFFAAFPDMRIVIEQTLGEGAPSDRGSSPGMTRSEARGTVDRPWPPARRCVVTRTDDASLHSTT